MKMVLFDFDYTLADSSKGIVKSFIYAVEKLKLAAPTQGQIKETIGMPLIDMFKSIYQADESYKVEMNELFLTYYAEEADRVAALMTNFYPDVRHSLDELKNSNLLLGIVSTKNRSRILETITLKEKNLSFDIIIGGEDVTSHKPSPEGLLKAATKMNIDIEGIVFIGDSYYDYKAACNAKCKFLAVLNGKTSRSQFIAFGQDERLIFNCIYDACRYILVNG